MCLVNGRLPKHDWRLPASVVTFAASPVCSAPLFLVVAVHPVHAPCINYMHTMQAFACARDDPADRLHTCMGGSRAWSDWAYSSLQFGQFVGGCASSCLMQYSTGCACSLHHGPTLFHIRLQCQLQRPCVQLCIVQHPLPLT